MLTAIIVAAGSSRRAGFDKLFAPLAGKPVIAHSLASFDICECVDAIVIVGRADRLAEITEIARVAAPRKVRAIVAGGEHRQDSVRRGLDQVDAGAQFVAIHDGARPLIRPAEIERVYGAAKQHGAAAAGAPVVDTLKRADEQLLVIGGVERERLFAMQTPQIFARSVLEKACAHVASTGLLVTDEVSAAELIGQKVAIVPNDQWNLKITYPGDLRIAEFLLSQHRNA